MCSLFPKAILSDFYSFQNGCIFYSERIKNSPVMVTWSANLKHSILTVFRYINLVCIRLRLLKADTRQRVHDTLKVSEVTFSCIFMQGRVTGKHNLLIYKFLFLATRSLFTRPLFQNMWQCVQLFCAECNAPCQGDLAFDKAKPPASAAK